MSSNADNVRKFREICQERNHTYQSISACISRYALENTDDNHQASNMAYILRGELSQEEMSDSVFLKALRIIGLTEEEIEKVK